MSFAARLMAGATLVTVPTIVYGGLVVLGVVTGGTAGPASRSRPFKRRSTAPGTRTRGCS